jgi:hypothetical protein
MPFTPISKFWPGTRAILLVHGIGDASTGKEGSFPLDVINEMLGADAPNVAIYSINYDFINDWLDTKIDFQAGITALKSELKRKLDKETADSAGAGNPDATSEQMDATIADYVGDVIWPILSANLRLAVRDALIAQLNQIKIDRGASARKRGDDPLSYQISIIAHSLGCFHTYEVLTAIANEPSHALRPRSDLVTFDSVTLMASPVQLIRTVAGAIAALVPDFGNLATLAKPLAIPAETRGGRVFPCTQDFLSITGSHDPVGGHLLGRKIDWAYMDLPGQRSIVVPQQALDIDTKNGTLQALANAFAEGGPKPTDPHSWSAYVEGQSELLRGVLLA